MNPEPVSTSLATELRELGRPREGDIGDRVFSSRSRVSSPIGDVYVAYGRDGIGLIRQPAGPDPDRHFANEIHQLLGRPSLSLPTTPSSVSRGVQTLDPSGVKLDLRSVGAFERDVLAAAATIPAGETRPYGWVAKEIERPRAVRAVGTALAKNPVPLLIPCHRVTRADHLIGQYIFGAATKAELLTWEGCDLSALDDVRRVGVRYLGNRESKVACLPTCHVVTALASSTVVPLHSAAEAFAEGFSPCRQCRPFTENDGGN